jgi:hypothetical protein
MLPATEEFNYESGEPLNEQNYSNKGNSKTMGI